jgi:hypothetical protein
LKLDLATLALRGGQVSSGLWDFLRVFRVSASYRLFAVNWRRSTIVFHCSLLIANFSLAASPPHCCLAHCFVPYSGKTQKKALFSSKNSKKSPKFQAKRHFDSIYIVSGFAPPRGRGAALKLDRRFERTESIFLEGFYEQSQFNFDRG